MFEKLRAWVLRVMRVPPEPEPPLGDTSKLRVFRASRRLYYLRLITWGAGQAAALAGILFWFSVIMVTEHEVNRTHAEAARRGLAVLPLQAGTNRPPSQAFKDVASRVPAAIFVWLWAAKGLGLAFYLAQFLTTYIAVRLDYELRWYMVTDRSLRIRFGLWQVQEITMSFANLQQVILSQGPLQRLMGIADVRVESAGGGGGTQNAEQGGGKNMHTGIFHGVENASEIRDLILDRLRQFRETGLGDPDEARHVQTTGTDSQTSDVVLAARELLAELRALRATCASRLNESLTFRSE
jgi:hypothetical protein